MLLKHLVGQGFHVKALYRPSSAKQPNPVDSVQWQPGSLADEHSLRVLVDGADAVVHCAGAVRGITLDQFKEVNTEGVTRILRAAIEQKVPRFLLMSSLAAREPGLSAYAASKKLGEDVLLGCSGKIEWEILRPPAVYGPGDREMQPLLQLIRRGIVPIIGDRAGRFSLIHVDDLVQAVHCLIVDKGTRHGRCFELHDGHRDGYTWSDIAKIATYLNGKEPFCLSVPRSLMQFVGLINISLARLFGYKPMLTPGKVREIFHPDWVCDNTAITGEIDWQPQISFQEGMRRLLY
jgi:nucleoside-diphosphate-sugar epimerase